MFEKFPPHPLIECFISNIKVTALINTGCMLSPLRHSVFDKLPDKPLLRNNNSNPCSSITVQSLNSQGRFLGRRQFSGSSHFCHTLF